MSPLDLQRFLRREECIVLLKQGMKPEVILEKYFGLSSIWRTDRGKVTLKKSRVENYFEDLFKDSHLSFEDIIRAYHCNPKNTLSRYRICDPILKG